MTKHIVFVYGTLKRPYGNHRCIEGAEFLGNAVSVKANFIMKHIGVPILQQQFGPLGAKLPLARVAGEVFEINDEQLARCDQLEGHPRMYKREERAFNLALTSETFEMPEGQKRFEMITAWVYLWQRSLYGEDVPVVDGAYDWDPRKIVFTEDEDDDAEEEIIEE